MFRVSSMVNIQLPLSCWFWKKKDNIKDCQQTPEECNSDESTSNDYDDNNKGQVQNDSKKHKQETFHIIKIQRCLKDRKIKSYPVSPDRVSHGDKGYLSDRRKQKEERTNDSFKKESAIVLVANSPQFQLKSKQFEPLEFLYEAPETSVPCRSSYFYGDKDNESISKQIEGPICVAEKPMEDDNLPSPSEVKDLLYSDKCNIDCNEAVVSESMDCICQEDSHKKAVIRFRPVSTGSVKPPGDLPKFMKSCADRINNQPQTYGKYVHYLPLKTTKRSIMLKTAGGRVLDPIESDEVKESFRSQRESEMRRISTAKSLDENSFPLNQKQKPPVYAIPVISTRRPSFRQSISRRPPRDRRSININEPDKCFAEADNNPEVYAVPVLTRGRKGSVLQQSVKTLVSKTDKPSSIHRKNIRYSMDTDVFSTETRRTSVNPSSPRYVNMEKGNPMLVSEVLSPITSIFVTDLKDRIPKDPLKKPKESNNWVKYKRYNEQPPKQSIKTPPKKVYIQENRSKLPGIPVRKDQGNFSSSSEEESDTAPQQKSNQYVQRKHQVYTVELPDSILPNSNKVTNKNAPFQKKETNGENRPQFTYNGDICGLNCFTSEVIETEESAKLPLEKSPTQLLTNCVHPDQKSNEEDIDILCYPSENFLRSSILAAESGSKLRWRIIIKRVEDK